MHDEALVKAERALILCIEDINRKHVSVDGYTIHYKVLGVFEHLSENGPSK